MYYTCIHGCPYTYSNLFTSWINNCKQTVTVVSGSSTETNLKYGDPQGYILDPCRFSIYTIHVGNITRKHHPLAKYLFYADDKSLYLIVDHGFTQIALSSMQSLISDIREWLIKDS